MKLSTLIASSVFHALQILLLPLAIVGYVLMIARVFVYSRGSSASVTVLASFYTRWMQHRLRTRCDQPCARLMRVVPSVSQLGLRLVTAPTLARPRPDRLRALDLPLPVRGRAVDERSRPGAALRSTPPGPSGSNARC
jgi:hypothetical protein